MLNYVKKCILRWATFLIPTTTYWNWNWNRGADADYWFPGRIWRGRGRGLTKNISSQTSSSAAVTPLNCSLPAPASAYFTGKNTSTTTTIAPAVSTAEISASESSDADDNASDIDFGFINQSVNGAVPEPHRRKSCRIQSRQRSQEVHFPVKKQQNMLKKQPKPKQTKTNRASSLVLRGSKSQSATIKKQKRSRAGYRCPYPSCNYKHQHLHLLKNHLGTAHNETRFKCRTCHKTFKHQGTLSRHVRTHRENKKHFCSFLNCKFSSFRNDDLRKHMRIHTGDKPFLCELCEFKCNQKYNLKSHAKRRHSAKV